MPVLPSPPPLRRLRRVASPPPPASLVMTEFRTQIRLMQKSPAVRWAALHDVDWTKSLYITREMIGAHAEEVFACLNTTFRRCPSSSAAASIFAFYRNVGSDPLTPYHVIRVVRTFENDFVRVPSVRVGFMERLQASMWASAHLKCGRRDLAKKVKNRAVVRTTHMYEIPVSGRAPSSIQKIWNPRYMV